MKLKFKHQPFQAEAAAAVCDVFNGQPLRTANYRIDLGDLLANWPAPAAEEAVPADRQPAE